MVEFCKRTSQARWFQNLVIAFIFAAGLVVGLETYPSLMERHGLLLHVVDQSILYFFVAEMLLKMTAKMPKPWEYFNDGWNVFDFVIVAVCFLPLGGAYMAVLRLARILRILRFVTAMPKLQMLVEALLKSISSMGYAGFLLFILFYIYAVLGAFLFGKNDPIHFGTLQVSLLTLFKVITLEGWIEILNIQIFGSTFGYEKFGEVARVPSTHQLSAPVYFVTFILFGTMIMMNLLIGIIISGIIPEKKVDAVKYKSTEI